MVNEMNVTTSLLVTDAKLRRIRTWLSPQDPSNNHNTAVSLCQEGTGQWFLRGEAFQRFKRGETSFLWLNGLPGWGKTILSSSIIENLKKDPSMEPLRQLYFYFDFNDTRKQTFESALRCLLWQASVFPGSSPQELEQLYCKCNEGETQPSIIDLIQILGRELQLRDSCIVIDALDECTTRQNLLAWLGSLAKDETVTARIIATSRKEQAIEVAFEQALSNDVIVSLQEEIVDADIGAYVKHRLHADLQLQRWRGRPAALDEIEAKLMTGAHGMYLVMNIRNFYGFAN